MKLNFLPRFFALVCLLAMAATMVAACRGGEQPAGDSPNSQVTTYRGEALAEIAGRINVPVDAENWGILVFAEGTSHMATTDRRGEFVLSGLPPGNYILRAARGDLEPILLADVLVRPEDAETQQPFMTLEPAVMQGGFGMASAGGSAYLRSGSLRGRVLTTNPPDSQDVVVEIPGTGLTTRTDSGGAYYIDNVPAGTYSLRFTKADYATLNREVIVEAFREAAIPDLRLELLDASSVVGRSIVGVVRVRTAEGGLQPPPAGTRVLLEGTGYQAVADAEGRFQIRGMEAGAFLITAEGPGLAVEQRFRVDLTEIPVAQVDLVLIGAQDPSAMLGIVVGKVSLRDRPGEGTPGIVVSLAGSGLITTTSSTGDFQITNVEPGIYTLVATLNGYEPGVVDEVDVPQGETVALDPLILEPEVQAPRVVATFPSNNARDVSILDPTEAVIVFDQAMDPLTLETAITISPDASFSLAFAGQHPLAGDDRVVVLIEGYGGTSGSPLRFDRRYTIRVAITAANRDGVPMDDDFLLNFTTGSGKIVGTNPADGSTGSWIVPGNPIRVLFNISVDPETVDSSVVRVRPDIGTVPNVSIVNNPRNGWSTMNIGGIFQPDTEYEVTIRGRIRSLGGQTISNIPYTFTFRTTSQSDGFEAFAPTDQRSRRDRAEEERRRR